MPIISVQPATVHFTAGAGLVQPPVTVAPSTANVSDQSYTFILHDQTVANMLVQNPGGGQGGGGATTPFFLGDDDAPNSKTVVANSVRLALVPLTPSTPVGGKATQLTVIGNDTGATAVNVTTGSGGLTMTTGTNGAISIDPNGTGNLTLGSADNATTALNGNAMNLDAAGALQINSSGGAISIANDNVDQTVNLATAGTRTLNIGINNGTDVTTLAVKGNSTHTGTVTVGVDGTGHDVKFFGATSGAYMLWDESQDDLIVGGAGRVGIGTTAPAVLAPVVG